MPVKKTTTPQAARQSLDEAISPHNALLIAQQLAEQFKTTAAARDQQGGTPKAERDLIRDSGLLSLSIAEAYGGVGASWEIIFASIRILAQVDSALAHVYAFHHLLIASVQLFAKPVQYAPWLQQAVAARQFWGNALNPLDTRTRLSPADAQSFVFNGEKSFSSGAIDSDMLLCSAHDDADKIYIALIPSQRQGLSYKGDWNNMGQRQTDSGSTVFDQVLVQPQELLLDPGPLSTPYSSLRPLLAQLIFVQLFLGVAEGAFDYARQQLATQKAWFKSPATRAVDDPYVQQHCADLWLRLESVRLLAQQAVQAFDQAWQQGTQLSAEQRGAVAIAIATAKIAASETGLKITQDIFQLLGARASSRALNLDRFWRNVRTQTLHDPIAYKYQEVGAWLLSGQLPEASFYS
jgi:alkylation response protein AidB-like acyl-CoA dehydrogenase